MRIPDYSDSDNLAELTEAIRYITHVALLPNLFALLILSCTDGFVDGRFFGLMGSSIRAIENIAIQNFEEVIRTITYYLDNEPINEKGKLALVDLLEQVNNLHIVNTDKPMRFQVAQKIICPTPISIV